MGLAGLSLGRELRALALSHTASVRRGPPKLWMRWHPRLGSKHPGPQLSLHPGPVSTGRSQQGIAGGAGGTSGVGGCGGEEELAVMKRQTQYHVDEVAVPQSLLETRGLK